MNDAAQLLETAFIQRNDMFASQLEDGRYVAIKEPLTKKHLALHLRGHITLGTYMLTSESTSRLMVLDADQENGLVNLANLSYELEKDNIPTYLETSRRGGHLWFFFDKPCAGKRLRDFGRGVIRQHQLEEMELYPKQDALYGGPGSLVRLPFGVHKKSGRRYPFIRRDGVMLAPTVRDQLRVLSNHLSVPEQALDTYASHGSEKRTYSNHKITGVLCGSSEAEQIKSAIPAIDFLSGFIDLRPIASGAIGHCPFHEDRNPSFGVNREGNYWHCFAGCGSGSIIDFWMRYKNIGFSQAVSELKDLLGTG